MKNVKIKSKQNEREITVTIYADGQEVDKIVRYHNSCMICKEESVNDTDFGNEYICPLCKKWLTDKLDIKPQQKNEENLDIEEKAVKSKEILEPLNKRVKTKKYNADIKIVNIVQYQNLMNEHHKINETVLTTIVDLVLKGVNTVNKINKFFKGYKQETIYIYLLTMARAGMLVACEYNKNKTSRYSRIFKVHPQLIYTSVK